MELFSQTVFVEKKIGIGYKMNKQPTARRFTA